MTSVITRITLVAVCLSTMLGASEKTNIGQEQLYGPLAQKSEICHSKKGFEVNGKLVDPVFLSKDLRTNKGKALSGKALKNLFSKNKTLEVLPNGETYFINTRQALKGGGVWGSVIGAWIGKAAVSIVCHGGIGLVGLAATAVGGPAAGFAVVTGLESTLGASIETASMAGAIGCGIAGGVLTGPV